MFDPGPITGWGKISLETKKPVSFGILKYPEELAGILKDSSIFGNDIAVGGIEQYLVRAEASDRGFQHRWNPVVAARAIGICHAFLFHLGVPIYYVQPSELERGYTISGLSRIPKSNPQNHAFDAVAHGIGLLTKREGKQMQTKSVKQTARNQSVRPIFLGE